MFVLETENNSLRCESRLKFHGPLKKSGDTLSSRGVNIWIGRALTYNQSRTLACKPIYSRINPPVIWSIDWTQLQAVCAKRELNEDEKNKKEKKGIKTRKQSQDTSCEFQGYDQFYMNHYIKH